ncbi:hypothetical protein KA082_03005 [Candidatus Woesebacteria bacterium]|nr:hypothetical protein [Candidatus Woesebacteria bacterium]
MAHITLDTTSSDQTGSTQFALFVKAHELQQISKILEQIMALPVAQRRVWVAENGEYINQALENFVQESNKTLTNLSFDDETLELSKKLILSLRDTVDMMQGLLVDRRK